MSISKKRMNSLNHEKKNSFIHSYEYRFLGSDFLNVAVQMISDFCINRFSRFRTLALGRSNRSCRSRGSSSRGRGLGATLQVRVRRDLLLGKSVFIQFGLRQFFGQLLFSDDESTGDWRMLLLLWLLLMLGRVLLLLMLL